ncbi:Acyl-[acyl-carrier-protein]--UDP-N-acetylglucosamine O-acyltransferase [Rubripirellula obstinata]|uniref:Acyl-[acyl-carrier-protein]--UDP-N-acetylglucosamine O-acyltransferase n=1 Tax=Rubripirellula obstinata TaxID=406547 RepID=A0A5B1CDR1_9BACT|nr:acyl-ACP--UDP-N-acetylglucosamine O-acyltransferase [Rubripirellula obstinata]KAA1257603.1 Acyl-[acyl-carrier-protein]--UDP-N-acetylglucosamine O-acyltransferase [Rubripirellula obstinata]
MGTQIAQTAVIDPRAKLGSNVQIGHFCIVGPDVTIGDDTRVENHVVLSGVTRIGEDNRIFSGCVIGTDPQDTSYNDTPTCVEIGHGNTIREHCTINRGTEKEDGITRVGDNNYLMTGTHVAHDCKLGDRIVIANNAMLGGHVHIGNDVTLAGGVGVNHFASIGQMSFVSAMSRVLHDVPPFMIVDGQPAKPRAVNSVGLKRHDYPVDDIKSLSEAYKLLYRSRVGAAAAKAELFSKGPIRPVLVHLFDFLDHASGGSHGRGRHNRKKAA